MITIKPRHKDVVKVQWEISKESAVIISTFAKYTSYDESYIINKIIPGLLDDRAYLDWLFKRRYNKNTVKLLGQFAKFRNYNPENVKGDVQPEESEEDSPFK